MPPSIPRDTRSKELSGSGLIFKNTIAVARTGRNADITNLSTISQYQRNPRKFVHISDDEHVVRGAGTDSEGARSRILVPLRAFKANRNAVVYEQIKVGAVIDSGFNVERIASAHSEASLIPVEFDWRMYLSFR